MSIPNFLNKSITIETNPNLIGNLKIIDRISPTLYQEFSNLNFAGVYKLGSKIDSRDCYIGSTYNITLKITHHLNLLYRGKHHSVELQDWVDKNGIENIDICVLHHCSNDPDEFESIEQYYLNLIKPRFNSILNKKQVKFEFIETNHRRYCNTDIKNEFGNSIVSTISATCTHRKLNVVLDRTNDREERRKWRPTIIIDTEDVSSITRGDMTKITKQKDKPQNEGFVIRKAFFSK